MEMSDQLHILVTFRALLPIEYEVGWTRAPGSTVQGGEKY